MGRIADCFNYTLPETLDFIAARGSHYPNACAGCNAERKARLRKAYAAFSALEPLMDPKGPTADFEALYARTRRLVAHLARLLRNHPPERCSRHHDPHPGWCDDCWRGTRSQSGGEAAKRALLQAQADAGDEVAEVKLERRYSKVCKHYSPFREPHIEKIADTRNLPKRYRLDCPLCEQRVNEGAAALRDEYMGLVAAEPECPAHQPLPGQSYEAWDRLNTRWWSYLKEVEDHAEWSKQAIAADLATPCEHVVKLPQPKRSAPLGVQEGAFPSSLPTVGALHALLGSCDRPAIARAIWALELHLQQLEDMQRNGGSWYSSVGLDYEAWADEASPNVVRSAFVDGRHDPSASADPLTEGEVLATRELEEEARQVVQQVYDASFSGFIQLEGGSADVLFDSDVAGSRFRFDELLKEVTKTTEERFDSSGMGETIEREMASTRPPEFFSQEAWLLTMLAPRLRARLDLLDRWDEAFVPPIEHLDEATVALLEEWCSVLSWAEGRACDPFEDRPSQWLCLYEPDEVRYFVRMRRDAFKQRERELALLGEGARVTRYHVTPAHLEVDDPEPPSVMADDAEWAAYYGEAA